MHGPGRDARSPGPPRPVSSMEVVGGSCCAAAGSSAHLLLEDCALSATDYPALWAGDGADPVIRRCRFRATSQDVLLDDGAEPVFADCAADRVTTSPPPADSCAVTSGRAGRRSRRRSCPLGRPAAGKPWRICWPNWT